MFDILGHRSICSLCHVGFSIFTSSGVMWVSFVTLFRRCVAFGPYARNGTGLVVWLLVLKSTMLPWSLVSMSVISLFLIRLSIFAKNVSSRCSACFAFFILVVCPARSVRKYSKRVNECWFAMFMRSCAACSGVICGPVYPREARVSRIMS